MNKRTGVQVNKNTSLEVFNNRTFFDALIEYYLPFWNHGLRFMEGGITDEPKPHFHGMVISSSQDLLRKAEFNIMKRFSESGIYFVKSFGYNSIHNRAGEFTFFNLKEDSTGSKLKLLRGRAYDLVIITSEIIVLEEMYKEILSFCKENDPSRIITLNKEEEDIGYMPKIE